MNNLKGTIAVLMTAGVFALPAEASADSFYVQLTGTDSITCGAVDSPCRTISEAIANATAGSTILVGPGRYGSLNDDSDLLDPGEENSGAADKLIVVDKQLTLLAPSGTGSVVLSGQGVSGLAELVSIEASGVEFGQKGKGFIVINNGSGKGVVVDGATSEVVILSNTFASNAAGDLTLAGTGNEASSNSFSGTISILGTGNVLEKNSTRDCGAVVSVDGSAHVLTKNRFTGGGSISLAMTSSTILIQQNEIFGNCGNPAVTINGGADHVVSKNTVTARGVPHFYVIGGSNIQFLGNTSRSGAYGFLVVGGTDFTFVGNLASGSGNYGFGINSPATNVTMEKNVSIGSGSAGFSFNPMLTLTFTGNSSIGNRGAGVFIVGAGVLTGNNIYGNDSATNCGLNQAGSSLATATGNFWGAAAGAGSDPADALCGNVAFIDATSPAADAFKVKAAKPIPY